MEKPPSPEERLREAQERISKLAKAQLEEAQALSTAAREQALASLERHRLDDKFLELSDARMEALNRGDRAAFDRLGSEMHAVLAQKKELKAR